MREQLSQVRPGPTLRAAAVFAVFLMLFLVVDRLSGPGTDDGQAVATTETTGAPETTAGPPTGTEPAEPPETTEEAPEGEEPPEEEPPAEDAPAEPPAEEEQDEDAEAPAQPEPEAPLRPADGITLQILNGTGELRLARDFKPLARQEGYQIVNSANANSHYPVSTVFYTPDHREDAEAFRARFPAFEVVAPAPDSLSDTVALHAVLGDNYQP